MQVRIFTLRFNPLTESFDDSQVVGFLADKVVLSIRDHFFVKDDTPYLTLVIRYRAAVLPPPADAAKPEQKRDESWRDELTETDWPLFNTLRTWRSERAKQEGIPPYVICNNRHLAEIVKIRPRTLAELGHIHIEGFGEAKLSTRHGAPPGRGKGPRRCGFSCHFTRLKSMSPSVRIFALHIYSNIENMA